MNKTNRELKEIVKEALEVEYGFAPTLKSITLIEASGDGTRIYFRVNDTRYEFKSDIFDICGMKTVWIGAGTITKLS